MSISEPLNPFDPGYYNADELKDFGFKSVGTNVSIAKNCTIIGLENIELGSNIRIDGGVVIAANSGFLSLGNHIHIGGNCFLACAGGISLADYSGLSQSVHIYSATDDYSGKALTNPTLPKKYLNVKIAPVILEKHVVVGSSSIVLPGCVIGEGASVGAQSLVMKSLESWGVYFGSPVKRIKARSKRLLDLEQDFLKECF